MRREYAVIELENMNDAMYVSGMLDQIVSN